jgi:hypothetical protein
MLFPVGGRRPIQQLKVTPTGNVQQTVSSILRRILAYVPDLLGAPFAVLPKDKVAEESDHSEVWEV